MAETVAWAIRVLGRDAPVSGREDEAWAWWSGEGLLAYAGITYRGSNGVVEVEGYASELGGQTDRLAISVSAAFKPLRLALLRELGEELVEVRWLRQIRDAWREVPGVRFVGRIGESSLVDGVFRAELEALQLGEQLPYGAWDDDGQQQRHPRDEAFSQLTGGISDLEDWVASTGRPQSTDKNPGELPELPPFPVPAILMPGRGQPEGTPPVLETPIPRQSMGDARLLRLRLSDYFIGDHVAYDATSDDPTAIKTEITGYDLLTLSRQQDGADATEIRVLARNRWGVTRTRFSIEQSNIVAGATALASVPNFAVEGSPEEDSITLTWNAPVAYVGSGVPRIELAFRASAAVEWATIFDDGAYASGRRVVGNLQAGADYIFRIRVREEDTDGNLLRVGPDSTVSAETQGEPVPPVRVLKEHSGLGARRDGSGITTNVYLGVFLAGLNGDYTVLTAVPSGPGAANVTSTPIFYRQRGRWTARIFVTLAGSQADYRATITVTATNPGTPPATLIIPVDYTYVP